MAIRPEKMAATGRGVAQGGDRGLPHLSLALPGPELPVVLDGRGRQAEHLVIALLHGKLYALPNGLLERPHIMQRDARRLDYC